VIWSPACEDVSPGAEDLPMLEDVTKHAVKTVTENIGLCVIMICEE
jgi:hypothetical protein